MEMLPSVRMELAIDIMVVGKFGTPSRSARPENVTITNGLASGYDIGSLLDASYKRRVK